MQATPKRAALAIGVGVLVVGLGTWGVLAGREPFATWYYLFAWYGTLLALDGVIALTGGTSAFLLLGRPAYLLTLLTWSALLWLFYELLNFRLANWYYVGVPADPAARYPAILFSFATVLPAVFAAEAALAGVGFARATQWPRLRVTPGLLRGLRVAGWLMLVLPLLWPRLFFPLVWGAATLLLEPATHRRAPERSLLADLEAGTPGRLLRLLLGGAAVGLLWELFNAGARGKWIYTVPGLDELKLFEMPVLGFLGFPPFAVCCFAVWQALVLGGVAVPRFGPVRPARRAARAGTALAAALFAALVLSGMERYTISSYSPELTGLPQAPAAALAALGYDVHELAAAEPATVAAEVGAETSQAEWWIEAARLATLRGIGTAHARALIGSGVLSVEMLALEDPGELAATLARSLDRPVPEARVRVWVQAARGEAGAR